MQIAIGYRLYDLATLRHYGLRLYGSHKEVVRGRLEVVRGRKEVVNKVWGQNFVYFCS